MDELAVLDGLQGMHAPWLDVVMVAVSAFGNVGAGWVVLGIVLIGFKRYRRTGIAVVVAVVVAGILSKLIIGELVMRPRPCDVNPEVPLLIPRPFGTSFPSGHASAAFAAAAVLIAFRMPKALTIPVCVIAVLVAISRLYLYVHYPTDVLAGALLGALVGVACWELMRPRTPEGAPPSSS